MGSVYGLTVFLAAGAVVIATAALWVMGKVGQPIFALVFLAGMTTMAVSAYYITLVTAGLLIIVGVAGSAGLWHLSRSGYGRHGKRRGN